MNYKIIYKDGESEAVFTANSFYTTISSLQMMNYSGVRVCRVEKIRRENVVEDVTASYLKRAGFFGKDNVALSGTGRTAKRYFERKLSEGCENVDYLAAKIYLKYHLAESDFNRIVELHNANSKSKIDHNFVKILIDHITQLEHWQLLF